MIRRLLPAALTFLAACGSDAASTVTQPDTTPPPASTTTTSPPATTTPTTTAATTPPTSPPGNTTTPPPPPTTEPPVEVELPDDPDAIVLQVEHLVESDDPVALAAGHPVFTLYRDGRLIVMNHDAATGRLAPLEIARVTDAGVEALVEAALRAGALDPLDSYGDVGVAGLDSTRFTVATAERATDFAVYALGDEEYGFEVGEFSSHELRARDDLLLLTARLVDAWDEIVGMEIVEPAAPFLGERLLVLSDSAVDAATSDLPADLTSTGTAYEIEEGTVFCSELVVDESPELMEIVIAADSRAVGHLYRQVLPHELGCDIMSAR